MKRVRRKETIGNTSQCLLRSKKRAESDPFYKFPLDLIIKILLILPAKSIAKLIFVSKLWSSIICGKDFTELYLTRSSTRPHLLFKIDRGHDMRKQFFHFSSEEDPSSAHHRVSCCTSNADDFYYFSPPIRGLICCLNDRGIIRNRSTRVMIGNPTTGQFITLPRVNTRKRGIISFFGYDPVNDLYKVLCMTVQSPHILGSLAFVTEEHQVFTLGSKQKWRMIECKHLHFLSRGTKGICNKGVVYYLAWINYVQSLICFDLRSESFNVIKLPENVKAKFLVNYIEKIAVTSMLFDGSLNLWVLNDASKPEWSKISIMVQSWRNFVGNHSFEFRGTLRTGELIFSPCYSKPYFLLCLDLKKTSARKVMIEGFGTAYTSIEVFLDYAESPVYLKLR